MGQCRPHQNTPDPSDIHNLHFLPPYSPQLNPTELVFSFIKAALKRRLGANQDEFLNTPPNLTLAEHRRRLLIQYAGEVLALVTPQQCVNWYTHCRRFLPLCIANEDLPEQI